MLAPSLATRAHSKAWRCLRLADCGLRLVGQEAEGVGGGEQMLKEMWGPYLSLPTMPGSDLILDALLNYVFSKSLSCCDAGRLMRWLIRRLPDDKEGPARTGLLIANFLLPRVCTSVCVLAAINCTIKCAITFATGFVSIE
jgi:hypothetical protein